MPFLSLSLPLGSPSPSPSRISLVCEKKIEQEIEHIRAIELRKRVLFSGDDKSFARDLHLEENSSSTLDPSQVSLSSTSLWKGASTHLF